MSTKPYITYPGITGSAEVQQVGEVVGKCYVNEPGRVSLGVIDYIPEWSIALHSHRTWELIIIDSSSEGPGYTFFDGRWLKADPGSAVFIPETYPHAWSSGNKKGFKMLWIYAGSHQEAGRTYHLDPETFRAITSDEEGEASAWTLEAVGPAS